MHVLLHCVSGHLELNFLAVEMIQQLLVWHFFGWRRRSWVTVRVLSRARWRWGRRWRLQGLHFFSEFTVKSTNFILQSLNLSQFMLNCIVLPSSSIAVTDLIRTMSVTSANGYEIIKFIYFYLKKKRFFSSPKITKAATTAILIIQYSW